MGRVGFACTKNKLVVSAMLYCCGVRAGKMWAKRVYLVESEYKLKPNNTWFMLYWGVLVLKDVLK